MKPRAAQISVNPSGLVVVTGTDVQAALAELDAAVATSGAPTFWDDVVTATGGETVLTLGATPASRSERIWRNSTLLDRGPDYTISGNTVTFTSALTAGDKIRDYYAVASGAGAAAGLGSAPLFVRATSAGGNGTSLVFTPAAAATTGHLLVATLNVSQYGGARTATPPSGWTQRVMVTNGNDRLYVFTKVAGSSEPSSYAFTISGGSENHSGVVSEFDRGDYYASATSTAGSTTSPAVTDAAGGHLGLAVWIADGANNGASTVSSGWTKAAEANASTFHGTTVAYANAASGAGASVSATVTTTMTPVTAAATLLIG